MKRNSRVYVCAYLIDMILSRLITDIESYPKSDMNVNNEMK